MGVDELREAVEYAQRYYHNLPRLKQQTTPWGTGSQRIAVWQGTRTPRWRLTTRYHGYIITDKSNEGQDYLIAS